MIVALKCISLKNFIINQRILSMIGLYGSITFTILLMHHTLNIKFGDSACDEEVRECRIVLNSKI